LVKKAKLGLEHEKYKDVSKLESSIIIRWAALEGSKFTITGNI